MHQQPHHPSYSNLRLFNMNQINQFAHSKQQQSFKDTTHQTKIESKNNNNNNDDDDDEIFVHLSQYNTFLSANSKFASFK